MGHPTWIYHDTEDARIVDSDECGALLAEGWRDSPGRKNHPADLKKADELSELKAEAETLGLRVTAAATITSLTKKIAEHKKQSDGS